MLPEVQDEEAVGYGGMLSEPEADEIGETIAELEADFVLTLVTVEWVIEDSGETGVDLYPLALSVSEDTGETGVDR